MVQQSSVARDSDAAVRSRAGSIDHTNSLVNSRQYDGLVSGVKKRQYQSATRDDGARRTRQAVVAAAAELFISRGYASTTLADVAGAAGVARPTVFAAAGSKAALLKLVLDQALSGDDEPVAVADRPWFAPV
jgi:hypothetical protein